MVRSGFRNDMLRLLLKNCEGSVIAEFALMALCFIALIPVICDVAAVINSSMILSGAVRSGTQYAISDPDDNSGIINVVRTASGYSGSTVTVTQFCQCLSANTTCGSVCSDGTGAKTYDTITATYSVPIILPYANYPNNSYNITQYATVQVK